MMTDVLNPISLPIQGSCLIEASAGTGKTYTLAALYLRLILGIHPDGSTREPLGVDQILVVTFTEAATQELRDRIRARIQEAKAAFSKQETADPFVADLLSQCDPATYDDKIELLRFAATEMDKASIFTIHGFCQRMLSQHAFESGSLFEQELVTDDTPLLYQALYDFWRTHYYQNVPGELAVEMLKAFKEPKDLLSSIRSYLTIPHLTMLQKFDESLFDLWEQQQQALSEFVQSWNQLDQNVFELIQNSGVNKRSYRKDFVEKWLNKLADYTSGVTHSVPWDVLGKFSQSVLYEKTPEGKQPPEHCIFQQIERLVDNRVPVKEVLIYQALHAVKERLKTEKTRKNIRTFDDLLSQLAAALQSNMQHELAGAIRDQYPVAMIDEFQDTDPLQYDIFRQVYSGAGTALLMIGDPKQSIYAFRGGDIFTYMSARKNADAHYTLDTNWRSSTAMVDSTNRLFEAHPNAFIYSEQIPFHAVRAAGKADKAGFSLKGSAHKAINFWRIEACSKSEYQSSNAEHCARQIACILNSDDYQIGNRKPKPSDIAVLVRDRNEAAQVQKALSGQGVSSVFMSNRESVFSSLEASELLKLLKAIQEPTDERLTRSAMATAMMQMNSLELDHLFQSEMDWELLVEELQQYQQQWLFSGVLPMLHTLLTNRRLTERMINSRQGERRLTDLLHLGELLQQASLETEGMSGLIHWLEDRINEPSNQSDAQQLRLESDSDRVTVITIHKSKGLEYNLVFLPFICRFREDTSYAYHNQNGEKVFDLELNEDAKEQVEQERLAEDLRLLYVAITRAVHACFFGMADIHYRNSKKPATDRSAIGYLLMQGRMLDEAMTSFIESCSDSALLNLESITGLPSTRDLFAEESDFVELSARKFSGDVETNWRLTSYSALSRHHESREVPQETIQGSVISTLDFEVVGEENELSEIEVEPAEGTIHAFPKGAVAGTFLHTLFELIDFSTVTPDELNEILAQQLQLNGFDPEWQSMLTEFVVNTLNVDLAAAGTRLRNITEQNRKVEMEFVLPFNELNAQALNKLLQTHDELAAKAGSLVFDQIKGMLKGYIDLMMRVGDQYFVVDYKSNWLGADQDSYTEQAMQEAMIDHRYDLQYVLYTLALHRLLKSRLPDYDYDRNVGGVYYLFLRGMNQGSETGIFYTKPSKELIESLDTLFGEVSA